MFIKREQAALLGKVAFLGLWQGRFPESDFIFTALHEVEPQRIGPLLGLAMSQVHQGNYSAAIDILRNKALTVDPMDPHARAWLGLALFRDGQRDKALEVLNELLAAEGVAEDARTLAQNLVEEISAAVA